MAAGLCLTLALGCVPAMAANTADKFPAINTYAGYSDVPSGSWYSSAAQVCFETGLMQGNAGAFQPDGTLSVAESAMLAANIHTALTGATLPAKAPGEAWYAPAITYLSSLLDEENEMYDYLTSVLASPSSTGSRFSFFAMLDVVLPADLMPVKNNITSIPGLAKDDPLLRFYNAGVLTGKNSYGTFAGSSPVTRKEVATMISRIVRPELAVSFTPATPDFSAEDFDVVEYATGISGSTPYASIGDQVISTNLYLSCYSNVFSDILQQCAAQNMGFSWDLYYGDTPIDEYMDGTAMAAAAYTLWHNAHKNDTYDTSSVLSAKHILISNQSRTDAEALALAKDLYSQLAASTFSPALFDELMNTYSEDGRNADGTLGAPDGYTFGPGEMVPEFEAGTKALALGAVSQPIKTDYGYHIILRTAPDLEDYISSLAYNAYKTWYRTASFVPGDGYNSLDLIEIATLMSLIVN